MLRQSNTISYWSFDDIITIGVSTKRGSDRAAVRNSEPFIIGIITSERIRSTAIPVLPRRSG